MSVADCPDLDQTTFGQKVRRKLRGVSIVRDVVAAYHTLLDHKTPLKDKVLIYLGVAYFLMPLDLIFDGLPFIGMADDVAVLGTVIKLVAANMTADHYSLADAWLSR